MTEAELREKCGLEKDGLVNSVNLGLLDILKVEGNFVTFGVLASGDVVAVPVETVISKLTDSKEE